MAIDTHAFGGDPCKWSGAVRREAKKMGLKAKFDSCGQYISAEAKGWKRERFLGAGFSDMDTVREALAKYAPILTTEAL